MKLKIATICLAFGAIMGSAESAKAIPILQTYIDGATYDSTTDTWVSPTNSGFNLWIIGNTGSVGSILDVHLSVAYDKNTPVSITLAPGTTGSSTFADSSTPSAPTSNGVTIGGTPTLTDGSSLATHGVYGANTAWEEFSLGNLTLTDSPITDFAPGFTGATGTGQINVYTVTLSDPNVGVHFDVYNHVEGETKSRNAPFSHDGEGGGGDDEQPLVPEPGSMLLFGLGIAGIAGTRLRRRKSEVVEA